MKGPSALQNSDDVGLRVDLKVTATVGSSTVEGRVNNVGTGSSGFNNAILT
jgi:hypothetical protein